MVPWPGGGRDGGHRTCLPMRPPSSAATRLHLWSPCDSTSLRCACARRRVSPTPPTVCMSLGEDGTSPLVSWRLRARGARTRPHRARRASSSSVQPPFCWMTGLAADALRATRRGPCHSASLSSTASSESTQLLRAGAPAARVSACRRAAARRATARGAARRDGGPAGSPASHTSLRGPAPRARHAPVRVRVRLGQRACRARHAARRGVLEGAAARRGGGREEPRAPGPWRAGAKAGVPRAESPHSYRQAARAARRELRARGRVRRREKVASSRPKAPRQTSQTETPSRRSASHVCTPPTYLFEGTATQSTVTTPMP